MINWPAYPDRSLLWKKLTVVWWHPCQCLIFLVFWEQYSYISIVFYSHLLSPLVSLQPLFTYDINDGLLRKAFHSMAFSQWNKQPAGHGWSSYWKCWKLEIRQNVLQSGDNHSTDYHTHPCYFHLRWLFSLVLHLFT